MLFVYSDAHLHLVDLEKLDPDFASDFLGLDLLGLDLLGPNLPGPDWVACVASHDRIEWERSESLRASLPPTFTSYGIHPQTLGTGDRDFLARLAQEGRIDCVGEAGFDFFGDRPERIRNPENLRIQRERFEFQLHLALERNLPLLVHMRRSTDIIMGYGKEMRRLAAVIFHCWPGRAAEGGEFLRKGVNAYFSFGTPLLRGGPRTTESCTLLPADRILSETDAPWQPPFGAPHTKLGHISKVAAHIASLRGMDSGETGLLLRRNFLRAYTQKELE